MLTRQQVLDLLKQQFIDPTKPQREHFAGIEMEFPLVNLAGSRVDFTVIHSLTDHFMREFDFERVALDNHGNTFSVRCPKTADILSYDCSYNNLEFSFGRVRNLWQVQRRFLDYLSFIQAELRRKGHCLTGMGINPHRLVNLHQPIPTGRYRMLYHHLSSAAHLQLPRYLHHYYDYGMFCSASQVQLDVDYEQLVTTLRTQNLLEPLKAVLFSNSVFSDKGVDYLCGRDMLWEQSMQGYNTHNVGCYEQLPATIDELLEYLASLSIYCTERSGNYLNFLPVPITEFFAQNSISAEYPALGGYARLDFTPDVCDLPYLRTYKLTDLTFRGTIEYRSCCCQPMRDALTVAAFHVGLAGPEQMQRVDTLLTDDDVLYGHGFTHSELRHLLVRRNWPNFVEREGLRQLLYAVLDIAHSGLTQRGMGEESLLNALYERAEALENPAQQMIRLKAQGFSSESLIQTFAAV
ncbi:MAG: hypothetical protein LBC35_01250 [Coriobacteriales bacterium]|jgi:gamma-glutamylcysteine synthetase|nr:hypothetical protein [Coriobacteriales bacterium]